MSDCAHFLRLLDLASLHMTSNDFCGFYGIVRALAGTKNVILFERKCDQASFTGEFREQSSKRREQ